MLLIILQNDIDATVNTWNCHLIRPTKNARAPSGRPNVMYQLPELFGTRNYLFHPRREEIQFCREECLFREPVPCDIDVYDMCCILMVEKGYRFPVDHHGALLLYRALSDDFKDLMN